MGNFSGTHTTPFHIRYEITASYQTQYLVTRTKIEMHQNKISASRKNKQKTNHMQKHLLGYSSNTTKKKVNLVAYISSNQCRLSQHQPSALRQLLYFLQKLIKTPAGFTFA